MIEKLPPSSEQHREVEFIWDDDVILQGGDSLTEVAGVRCVFEWYALAILVSDRCFPNEVSVGLSPAGMIYIVVTPVNGTGDIAESQKCWDCVSVGL